ncbi:tetratricopeptide repeat protein [Tsuneonella mangrovi]|uniref:tetratricopeptide repeat protein n=1 Tax=Tsuneonella mangrovi TaxID=1982042 RepID=UPI001F0A341F|nr:tetratricopeptide repeat protein [Tsuneonella mangrovi]
MSYLPIVALAVLAFAVAVLVLRLPRGGWTLFAAALVFGLAGYAHQGSPGLAGSPRPATTNETKTGTAMVEGRRELFGPVPPSSYVTMADGFARRGQFADAAGILRAGVDKDPNDVEAWLALANALVEQAEGKVTPAALYAYKRAQTLAPDNPGPGFFLGVALIRTGQLDKARGLWAEMLKNAPADAPWRPMLADRVEALDMLIARLRAGASRQ